MTRKVTKRQVDALRILAADPGREWTAGSFAAAFWPGKEWMLGGSRWNAAARHGGRMLAILVSAGLVTFHFAEFGPYSRTYYYLLTEKGKAALEDES